MQKITIKDVAREAGVSTTLVSRVLNAPLNEQGQPVCAVNKQTAARIMEMVDRLGYRPNTAAASLRRKRADRIGVILPDISHPFFASMAREFEKIAVRNGYTVLFGSSGDDAGRIESLAMTFLQDNADGIILIPGIDCKEVVEAIIRRRIPLTLVIRDIPGLEQADRVLTDNAAGTKLALDHLVGQGFRKIEMLSSTLRISNNLDRERQFTLYMEQAGREPRIVHCDHKHPEESMRYILEDAARRGVDAFYTPNASLPVLCFQACRDMNLAMPERPAVMGYDIGPVYSLLSPSITHISYSMEQVAAEAFRVSVLRMKDFSTEHSKVLIPPRLIVGDSTRRHLSVTASAPAAPLEQLREAMRLMQGLEPFLTISDK